MVREHLVIVLFKTKQDNYYEMCDYIYAELN